MLSMARHDRSVWFDLICIMHDSPERGVLLLPNGRPMTDEEIARALGLSTSQAKKSLIAILDSGSGSRRDDGAIQNRRMMRDEDIRQKRKVAGHLGGNPNLLKQNPTTEVNHPPKQIPTPSSSSSSSPSGEGNINNFLTVIAQKPEKGRRATPAPDSFEVSPEMQTWANANGITADLELETAKMLDHFRGHGKPMKDWFSVWRNWMRNSANFGPRPQRYSNTKFPLKREYTDEERAKAREEMRKDGIIQ